MKTINNPKNIITNIHPIEGVTATQLYTYCQFISKLAIATNLQLTKLEQYQIDEAIGDAVMNVLNKMQTGVLNKTIFEQFKDYVYVTLLNCLKIRIKQSNYHINNITGGSAIAVEDIYTNISDSDEYSTYGEEGGDDAIYENKVNLLHKAIAMLSTFDQKIYYQVTASHRQMISILATHGQNKHYFNKIIDKIKDNVSTLTQQSALDKLLHLPYWEKYDTLAKIEELNKIGQTVTLIGKRLDLPNRHVRAQLKKLISPTNAHIIRKMTVEGVSANTIANKLGVKQHYVNMILKLKKRDDIKKNKLLTSVLKDRLIDLVAHKRITHVEEDIKPTYQIKNKTVRKDANGQIEHIGEDIKRLRAEGMTYNQIKAQLNCSKATISYHCSEGGKGRVFNRQTKNRAKKKDN